MFSFYFQLFAGWDSFLKQQTETVVVFKLWWWCCLLLQNKLLILRSTRKEVKSEERGCNFLDTSILKLCTLTTAGFCLCCHSGDSGSSSGGEEEDHWDWSGFCSSDAKYFTSSWDTGYRYHWRSYPASLWGKELFCPTMYSLYITWYLVSSHLCVKKEVIS